MTRFHRWIGLLGLLCAVNGCFRHRADIALLEGELRWMEDQLYAMEDKLALKSRQLTECRDRQESCCVPEVICDGPVTVSPRLIGNDYELIPSETDALRAPGESPRKEPTLAEPPRYEVLDETRNGSSDADRSRPPASREPTETYPYEVTTPPDLLSPPDEIDEPQPPEISPPPPDTSGHQPSPMSAETIQLSSHMEAAPSPEPETPSAPNRDDGTDVYVTHVLALAWLAHGRGFDDQPADVDLLVVVEPRNVDGEPVLLGGPLSVVVLDAGQPKESARVARWDYSAAETRRMMQTSRAGRGIHLALNWPETPPDTDQLHVFVRYTTVEERALEHDVPVSPQRPDQSPIVRAGWRSNTRRPPTPPTDSEERSETTQVASGIKLRPIPKTAPSPPPSSAESIVPSNHLPIILEDERPPQWSPERP